MLVTIEFQFYIENTLGISDFFSFTNHSFNCLLDLLNWSYSFMIYPPTSTTWYRLTQAIFHRSRIGSNWIYHRAEVSESYLSLYQSSSRSPALRATSRAIAIMTSWLILIHASNYNLRGYALKWLSFTLFDLRVLLVVVKIIGFLCNWSSLLEDRA